MTDVSEIYNLRTRPFKILELISMIKMANQGIIICSYDNNKTLDFFRKGLRKMIIDNKEKINIYEQEKNEEVLLSKFILSHSKYNNSNENESGVISNIYRDNDLPSFELLNQARSYHTKINYPIIFWFYEPCISWLYKFAPDFMRVQIGFFEFSHEDAVSNMKLLGLEFPMFSQDEKRIEFFKREIMKSYSAKNLVQARKFLEHISKILNLELKTKDLVDFAIEMIETGNEHLLERTDKMIRKLVSEKGKDRVKEDRQFSEYCKQVAEGCKKIGKTEMSEIYSEYSENIDVDMKQLFMARKKNNLDQN